MVGVQKALKQCQIWAIRYFLGREGRMRDRALFDLAIDSKLRGCYLVQLTIGLRGLQRSYRFELTPGNTARRIRCCLKLPANVIPNVPDSFRIDRVNSADGYPFCEGPIQIRPDRSCAYEPTGSAHP